MVHTTLGGVKIRPDASTQVDGLFAAGEVSGGIHGANRIGGCAGSETVSFGAISGRSAAKYALSGPKAVLRPMQIQEDLARRTEHLGSESIGNLQDLKEQSLRIADDALGIIRSASSLRLDLMPCPNLKMRLRHLSQKLGGSRTVSGIAQSHLRVENAADELRPAPGKSRRLIPQRFPGKKRCRMAAQYPHISGRRCAPSSRQPGNCFRTIRLIKEGSTENSKKKFASAPVIRTKTLKTLKIKKGDHK